MDGFAENYQKRLSWTRYISWALRMNRVFPDERGILVRGNPLDTRCGLGQDRAASLGNGVCGHWAERGWKAGGVVLR